MIFITIIVVIFIIVVFIINSSFCIFHDIFDTQNKFILKVIFCIEE